MSLQGYVVRLIPLSQILKANLTKDALDSRHFISMSYMNTRLLSFIP